MALFNRKQKNSSVLPEVDQYYQGERRDRTWLAWILAAVSIVIVVLILVGLYFAGKWAYNALTDDETSQVADNTVQDNDTDLPSIDGEPDVDNQESDDQADDESESGEADDEEAENTADDEGTVEAPAQTTIPSSQTDETPRTGASSEGLPNTGPGNIAAAFMVTSGIAGTAHYVVTRRRSK